jgi:L,D-transpeptidase catalytic domain
MVVEPFSRRPRRRSRRRPVVLAVVVVLLLASGATAAALMAWPEVGLEPDPDALAQVAEPGYAGHVSDVVVRRGDGNLVPTHLRDGRIWPAKMLPAGDSLTVELTVHRPAWAGWLVGHSSRKTFQVRTPSTQLRGRWLEVPAGRPVVISFDTPVHVVELRDGTGVRTLRLAHARANVRIGVVATGAQRAGSITVRSTPRTWEKLSAASRVSWFPARARVQALVEPAPEHLLAANDPITVTFSRPTEKALGTAMPTITPTVSGRWRRLDTHSVSFRPSGLGYPLGGHVEVRLPASVDVARPTGEQTTWTFTWEVRHGTILRLHQLLAEVGYLPVAWSPSADPVPRTADAQLAAVALPPAGHFSWPYANTPPELKGIWRTFKWNEITRGAVMMFEHDHDLDVDAFVGPKVWHALLADAVAGNRRTLGYSYVYVHRNVPQSLTLWHDGETILSSPGNTGVPAAPTQLGTFPVFEHIPIGRMSGTNPDGSHYDDPGVRYISYFNHGDAIHAFNRGSFGTPQSLGCVELPLAAAAKVWPYTPIGTLVTVEN